MSPSIAYYDKHAMKNNDFITYGDIINSYGKIKSCQEFKDDGGNIKLLVYFQFASLFREQGIRKSIAIMHIV